MEDLQSASKLLLKALKLRERYMKMSRQKFPTLVDAFICGSQGQEESNGVHSKPTIAGKYFNFLIWFQSFECCSILHIKVNLLVLLGFDVALKVICDMLV